MSTLGTSGPVTSGPAAPGGPAVAEPLGAAARRRWGRARWGVTVAGVVLLLAVLVALLTPRTTAGRLDPDSAAPGGARAVAEVLRREGVEVTRTTLLAQAEGTPTDATLLVTDLGLLTPAQLRRLAGTGADLVLLQPDAVALGALAPGVRPAGTADAETAEPLCTDPDAVAAGAARAGGRLYTLLGTRSGAACYPVQDGGAASLVVTTDDRRRVAVVGQPDLLVNAHLGEQGNAALALRLLGRHGELVWYLPDPLDLAAAGEQVSLRELVPPAVPWVAAQLGLVAVVVLLWRGRRLGRLVTEPLPVVVRAAETQEGRARLYRRARARDRAAATLRTAAVRRVARRLDVPSGASPQEVAALLATTSGLPPERVHATLLGPAPADDAGLVALADALDHLERSLDHDRKAAP